MVELSIGYLRCTLALAFLGNAVVVAALILSNVVHPDYFHVEGTSNRSNIYVNNVQTLNKSVFKMSGLNFIIRYILAPLYALSSVFIIAIFLRSITRADRLKHTHYQTIVRFTTLLEIITWITHCVTISAAVDIMRVFARGFESILTPWVGTFPWHLIVLFSLAVTLISIISLIMACAHYYRYYSKQRIRQRLLQSLPNTRKPGEYSTANVQRNIDIPELGKTRVIRVEAEAPLDLNGKVRVLLKEKEDGEFEIITEDEFKAMQIDEHA